MIRPSAQGGLDLKKVLPFLFMVIKFGSTCLRGCIGVGLNILLYVHILSVSDVDEFKYGAEPERSVDQRARLRGWPMCDTCL